MHGAHNLTPLVTYVTIAVHTIAYDRVKSKKPAFPDTLMSDSQLQ